MSAKIYQILGMGAYYIPVLFDILKASEKADSVHIFKNITEESHPIILTTEFPYKIMEMGIAPRKDLPCIFGVSGSKNKVPVLEYFSTHFGIHRDNFETVKDPSAAIAISAKIDSGCFIEQNVSVSSQVNIGFGVSVKRNVSVGHHSNIGDFVDLNPGTVISGRCSIGRGTTIGSGAVLLDKVKIGENTIIGAGSVVTKDIPSGVVAYGNPCKVIRDNN